MDLLGDRIHQKVIRRNHTRSYPYHMVFYDAETDFTKSGVIQKHRLKLSWAFNWERRPDRPNDKEGWESFTHTYPFCKWLQDLTRDNRPLWLFGHNLFFDLQVSDFFYFFPAWGWTLDFIYEKGMSFILVVKQGKKTIRCVSTTNYFDVSLEKLGESVGLKKGAVDFATVDPAALSEYCKRDVEIIVKAMKAYFDFIQIHDLGKFSMTRAAQAFNAYRHRFMNHRILVHREETLIDLERKAYMGSRVECFQLGRVKGGPFLTLDINGMYPFVMRRYLYPSKFLSYHPGFHLADLKPMLKEFCAVAECLIDTDTPIYAVRSKDKIIFPTGRFKAYLCTGGLETALARGHLQSILKISFFTADDLFSDFINYFQGLKERYEKDGNGLYRWYVKYFLNSLYGKFAQFKPVLNWQDDPKGEGYYRREAVDLTTGERLMEYRLFNKIVWESGKEIGNNSLIAISAHITEHARLLLNEIMEKTGRKRVLYCDTDSIKIRKSDLPFVNHPIHSHNLGSLKSESESKRLRIIGPKSYETETHRVLKGIPKHAEEIAPLTFRYTSFPKMATHQREENNRYFAAREVTKTLRQSYDKGEVQTDGRVTPFCLTEF